jgi:hypothetical protein
MRVGCEALAGVHHRGLGAYSSNCYITDFSIQTGRQLGGSTRHCRLKLLNSWIVGNPPLPNENSLQDGFRDSRAYREAR